MWKQAFSLKRNPLEGGDPCTGFQDLRLRRDFETTVSVKNDRASVLDHAGLIGKHDRYAVTDRVSQFGAVADQLLILAVIAKPGLCYRTNENLQKAWIDGFFLIFVHLFNKVRQRCLRRLCVNATMRKAPVKMENSCLKQSYPYMKC